MFGERFKVGGVSSSFGFCCWVYEFRDPLLLEVVGGGEGINKGGVFIRFKKNHLCFVCLIDVKKERKTQPVFYFFGLVSFSQVCAC